MRTWSRSTESWRTNCSGASSSPASWRHEWSSSSTEWSTTWSGRTARSGIGRRRSLRPRAAAKMRQVQRGSCRARVSHTLLRGAAPRCSPRSAWKTHSPLDSHEPWYRKRGLDRLGGSPFHEAGCRRHGERRGYHEMLWSTMGNPQEPIAPHSETCTAPRPLPALVRARNPRRMANLPLQATGGRSGSPRAGNAASGEPR
jgi:hypothetical protein